jgi:hypothetical protein
MSLTRTIYISQSTINPEILEDEVSAIVKASVRNNRAAELTGMLLTHDGWFLQALEGPMRQVEGAMDRIRRDKRHRTIRVLSVTERANRIFGQWNMCARTLNQVDAEILATLDARGVNLAQIAPAPAERLLLLVKSVRGAAAERSAIHAA